MIKQKILLLFFTVLMIVCSPLTIAFAEENRKAFSALTKVQEMNWEMLNEFGSRVNEGQKFYAIHLNGTMNYPVLNSTKDTPPEIESLLAQAKNGEITTSYLKTNYQSFFDKNDFTIYEDQTGNKYLLIMTSSGIAAAANASNGHIWLIMLAIISVIIIAVILTVIFKKRQQVTKTQTVEKNHQEAIDKNDVLIDEEVAMPIIVDIPPEIVEQDTYIHIFNRKISVAELVDHPELSINPLKRDMKDTIEPVLNKLNILKNEIKNIQNNQNEKRRLEEQYENTFLAFIRHKEELEKQINEFTLINKYAEHEKEKTARRIENDIVDILHRLSNTYVSTLRLSDDLDKLIVTEEIQAIELKEQSVTKEHDLLNIIEKMYSPMFDTVLNKITSLEQENEQRIFDIQQQDIKLSRLESQLMNINALFQKKYNALNNWICEKIEVLDKAQEHNAQNILRYRAQTMELFEQLNKQHKEEQQVLHQKLLVNAHENDVQYQQVVAQLDDKLAQQNEALLSKIGELNHTYLNKLENAFSQERLYLQTHEEVKSKFDMEVDKEVLDSLTLGRYMYKYQRELFKEDASIIYMAYVRSIEKVLNLNHKHTKAVLSKALYKFKSKIDFTWIVPIRNQAAHKGNVTIDDVEKIDKALLEEKVASRFNMAKFIEIVMNEKGYEV